VLLPVIGLVGAIQLVRRDPPTAAIVFALPLAVLGMAALLGAGKPAEYARFMVLPQLILVVFAACVVVRLAERHPVWALLAVAAMLLVLPTPAYVRSFVRDAAGRNESRKVAGEYLQRVVATGAPIGVLQEPAPYAVPPLDFTRRTIMLLPHGRPADLNREKLPEWLVFTADDSLTHAAAWWHRFYERVTEFPPRGTGRSPIAWADKPVFVYRRVAR
jgi:hypothetical protein